MFEKNLYEQYGIRSEEVFEYKGNPGFLYNQDYYVLFPLESFNKEELVEMKIITDFLSSNRIQYVASIIPTYNQEVISTFQNQSYVLLKLPRNEQRFSSGDELAVLHKIGLTIPFPPQKINRAGKWGELWIVRLEQLEGWWRKKINGKPVNRFEELFFETFPYFLGVTENAIQYVKDCQLDDFRGDYYKGTVCHMRFKPNRTTQTLMPFELVYDHPVRDISEWIRCHFINKTSSLNDHVISFLNNYERVMPLTVSDWRLMFGRLLFPVYYFELVENYYSSTNPHDKGLIEQKFIEVVASSKEYDLFLGGFYQTLGLPTSRLNIPSIHWLNNKYSKNTKFNTK